MEGQRKEAVYADLRDHAEDQGRALAGGNPMRHGKKTGRGFHERLTLLERFHASAVKCF
ncbi:MAG: hypothetical protein F4020_05650, partial [Gammaproteobacteria bacterium]|nr:hypothetical protein [Gammaproteobacteria bacterium]